MARVIKRVRLVNPGRKRGRRNMTAKQIRYFGTRQQKAALKRHRKRSTVKRRVIPKLHRRRRARVSNVGEIITLGLNPGTKRRKVVARKKRRVTARKRVTSHRRRRRANPASIIFAPQHRARRRSNRRRNPFSVRRRRAYGRRRNPEFLKGRWTDVASVISGAAITKIIVDKLPFGLSTGIAGYISTGVVAGLLGWGVEKFAKKPAIGRMMAIGGMTYLGLKLVQDFVPGLMSISPFGLKGMGIVGPGSFYTPQVPMRGSMSEFMTPNAVSAAIAASAPHAMKGMGVARRAASVR